MKKSILTLALTLMSTLFFAQDFANYAKYEKDNVKVKSQNTVPMQFLWEILLRKVG
jgi:hypothetical protein